MEELKQNQNNIVKMDLDSYEGNEPYIFVSYSHVDTDIVYKILKLIDREKYRFGTTILWK